MSLVVATQRTQALHNAVLGSCDTAIVHRFTLPADQKPVRDWLKGNIEDRAIVAQIDTGMSSIPTGSAWLCCSEQKVFEFVEWPRITTFDNSATPKKGAATPRSVKTAAVDIEALKAMMGAAMAEAAASDPKALQAELAKLRRELAAAQKHPAAAPLSPADQQRLRQEGYEEALRAIAPEREAERAEAFALGADAMLQRLQEGATAARAKLAPPKMKTLAAPAPRNVTPPKAPAPAKAPNPARPAPAAHAPRPAPPRPVSAVTPLGGITGPQGVLLKALAWWAAMGHDRPTRAQAAAMAGWRVTSGHIKNIAGELRTAGLIDFPGQGLLCLTPEGAAIAPEPDLGQGFRASLRQVMSGPQRELFDAVLELGGRATRTEACEHLGWSPTSGHVKNIAGELRTMQVLAFPEAGVLETNPWAMAE